MHIELPASSTSSCDLPPPADLAAEPETLTLLPARRGERMGPAPALRAAPPRDARRWPVRLHVALDPAPALVFTAPQNDSAGPR